MTPPWKLGSLRARLTLWSAAVSGVVLLVFTGGISAFLRASLYEELDRQLHDEVELFEASLRRTGDGRITRWGGASSDPDMVSHRLEVWGTDGSLLYSEGSDVPGLPPPDPGVLRLGQPAGAGTARTASGSAYRVHGAAAVLNGSRILLRVARPETSVRHELHELLVGVAFGLPAAILFACLGGYFLAGRALGPVGEMAAEARTITAERLSKRLSIKDPDDELGRLGTVFNHTLARLEHSFYSLRRFTADAAHELRTPLTALRSVGEVALREANTAVDAETVASMLEEVDRLATLVDALLLLSRADGGHVEVRAERFELREFARDAAEYLDALANERGQSMVVEGTGVVYVRADPRLVRQAVFNVLDNAIKHSPEESRIRIVVRPSGDRAVLEILDEGQGIPAEHRDRVFERFYRIDCARSRETGGAGLGLSISQWAVRACGGSIELVSSGPTGSCFRIRLPLDEGGSGNGLDGSFGDAAERE